MERKNLDFKQYFKEFLRYNRLRIFKLILYGLIIVYLLFLICYNIYRINLGYSLELSWIYGFLSALITTIIIVLSIDVLSFFLKIRKTPIELLEQS